MKIFKSLSKRIFSLNTVFVVFFLFVSHSCTEDDAVAACTGCSSASPYSKPGSTACYATLADCQAALGSGCVICN